MWSEDACACVIIASGGYPGSYEKGKLITGLDENGEGKEFLPMVDVAGAVVLVGKEPHNRAWRRPVHRMVAQAM